MKRSTLTVAFIALALSIVGLYASASALSASPASQIEQAVCLAAPAHATGIEESDVNYEISRVGTAIAQLFNILDAPASTSATVRGMGRIVRVAVLMAFSRYMYEQFDDAQQKIAYDFAKQIYNSVTSTPTPQLKKQSL